MRSSQPRREERLDLLASSRLDQLRTYDLLVDDEQRGHALDAESLEQVAVSLPGDAVETKRVVVVPALQHLGEIALGTAAAPGRLGVEEEQDRPVVPRLRRCRCCQRVGHVSSAQRRCSWRTTPGGVRVEATISCASSCRSRLSLRAARRIASNAWSGTRKNRSARTPFACSITTRDSSATRSCATSVRNSAISACACASASTAASGQPSRDESSSSALVIA